MNRHIALSPVAGSTTRGKIHNIIGSAFRNGNDMVHDFCLSTAIIAKLTKEIKNYFFQVIFQKHPSLWAYTLTNRFNRINSIGSVTLRSNRVGFVPDCANAHAVLTWIKFIGHYLYSELTVRSLCNTPKVSSRGAKSFEGKENPRRFYSSGNVHSFLRSSVTKLFNCLRNLMHIITIKRIVSL